MSLRRVVKNDAQGMALLRHHEFAAREILTWPRQENGKLQGKDMLAVQILVQTIVIVDSILKQKRRRFDLAGFMATRNEIGMMLRVAHRNAHCGIPAIGDRHKMRIDSGAKVCQNIGQRIAKILIFAAPESVTRHDHPTSE